MNGDPVRWLVAAARYGFGLVLLPFVFGEPGSDRRALVCAKAMIAGVVLMEAFGAAIFYGYEASYQEYQKISENFITGGGRLGAFVGQPNWNAAVIAMALPFAFRSEEHTSELQSLMRISYAVFCLKKKKKSYTS